MGHFKLEMSRMKFLSVCFAPALLVAQSGGLAPTELLKPLKDSWPTYNGDYSGRRRVKQKRLASGALEQHPTERSRSVG